MSDWYRIATLDQCPPGSATQWVAGDHIVALFNVDGTLYALDGMCPHQGGPLGAGKLEGDIITCPWHGWKFQVRTGQHVANPLLCHARWEVRVEDGEVMVRMAQDDL